MTLTLTGKSAEAARQRAESLGLDPVTYLERLIVAETRGEAFVDDLLREADGEPEVPWDVDAIRRNGRALAERMRRA